MPALRTLILAALFGHFWPGIAQATATTPANCHSAAAFEVKPAHLCIRRPTYNEDICTAIETFARHHALPPGFFARLIWQESRFNPNAVSPKGAQGIAQFMPGTARLRGLDEPFNPAEALARSAEYLRVMEREFGNLGLAAAGYNAGEGRVRRLLDRGSAMPFETRHFVRIITGRTIDAWHRDARRRDAQRPSFALEPEMPFHAACVKLASTRHLHRNDAAPEPAFDGAPWGVEVAAHARQAIAERMFARIRDRFSSLLGSETPLYVAARTSGSGTRAGISVRIGRDTREASGRFCSALRREGAYCVVRRNR